MPPNWRVKRCRCGCGIGYVKSRPENLSKRTVRSHSWNPGIDNMAKTSHITSPSNGNGDGEGNGHDRTSIELEKIESEEQDRDYSPPSYDIVTYPADYTLQVLVDKWRRKEIIIPQIQRRFVWT